METRPLNKSPFSFLATLHSNPFLFAPLFEVFFYELERKERSLLLAYLVLPLVLPEFSRAKLSRTTSLRRFTSEPSRTYGLASRIAEYKLLTHITLQHNLDIQVLSLEEPATFIFRKHSTKSDYFANTKAASK